MNLPSNWMLAWGLFIIGVAVVVGIIAYIVEKVVG